MASPNENQQRPIPERPPYEVRIALPQRRIRLPNMDDLQDRLCIDYWGRQVTVKIFEKPFNNSVDLNNVRPQEVQAENQERIEDVLPPIEPEIAARNLDAPIPHEGEPLPPILPAFLRFLVRPDPDFASKTRESLIRDAACLRGRMRIHLMESRRLIEQVNSLFRPAVPAAGVQPGIVEALEAQPEIMNVPATDRVWWCKRCFRTDHHKQICPDKHRTSNAFDRERRKRRNQLMALSNYKRAMDANNQRKRSNWMKNKMSKGLEVALTGNR